MVKITPSEMLYRKLKPMEWKEKIYLVHPSAVGFDSYNNKFWRFSDYNEFTITKVGKLRSTLCASFAPKSTEFTVSNKRIATKAEWAEAMLEWDKKKLWMILNGK